MWLLSALLLLMFCSMNAQSPRLKKAGQYFEKGDFREAINLYEEILQKEDVPEAKIRIAEAYRHIGNYPSAALWYAQVVNLPESQPLHKFYYGLMLLRNEDCKSAERWFREYLKYEPYDLRKPYLLDACGFMEQLKHKNEDKLELQLPSFNSPAPELGPAYYKDSLVFSSYRQPESDDSPPFLGLHRVGREWAGGEWAYSSPEPFSGVLNSKFHEGVAVFNKDLTEIFFTRTRETRVKPGPEGIHRLEIATARRLPQGNWSELHPLPFSSDEYSVAHPSLSGDGKRLYFSSDMPGGYGGKDLYMAFLENKQWGPPLNLGPTINTPKDEVFPHITASGNLYFSSDGHFGMGGQDIYRAREGADGLWAQPENLGFPFNTLADDFGIIFNETEKEGYFTSNRSGGAGRDDIYFFELKNPGFTVKVEVVDLNTGLPIPDAKAWHSCSADTLTTGQQGQLFLQLRECCTITGNAAGFQPFSVDACRKDGPMPEDTLFIALALRPEEAPEASLSLETEAEPEPSATLQGVAINKLTGLPVRGATIMLSGSDCTAPTPVLTDEEGRFTFSIPEGCCFKLRAERDNFFVKYMDGLFCAGREEALTPFTIQLTPYTRDAESEGEGERIPVKMDADENEFGISAGPAEGEESFAFRVNLYYDVGRSSVQKGSVPELNKLLRLMQENPDIIVEIRSHTDSQGDEQSNMRLSQRRADAVVRFLLGQGIERERLLATGYGETRLVNDCRDGIPCTEEQHQENRRTEFSVLGKVQ